MYKYIVTNDNELPTMDKWNKNMYDSNEEKFVEKDKLYLVIPAYNEEDTIEDVIKSWYKVLSFAVPSSKLVVADSGSTDKTHEILTSLQSTLTNLVILSNTIKYHGPKLIAMYKYAIEQGAEYIFQTDSDGQTDPKEFERFWKMRKDYDAILGNRVVRGDGVFRKVVEIIVCILLRIIFGVKVKDSNAPFRLMKTSLVEKYIGRFKDDYNLPNIMLTTFFSYYKEKITYEVITFKNRQGGKNSIDFIKIFKIGTKAIGDMYEFRRNM